MAKVTIESIITPEVWEQYFIERTAELSRFLDAGVVQVTDEFNMFAAEKGQDIEMPFWQDLSGARQVIQSNTPFTTNLITASQDRACQQYDGNAWSANMLAKHMSGSDPLTAVGELVGQYWARTDETTLLAELEGVRKAFDAESGDPNFLKIAVEATADVTTATCLNGETFIDAKQKLGDAKQLLTAIAMHSEVEAYLEKLQLIATIPDADARGEIKTFMGNRVITDDSMPKTAGSTSGFKYVSILFGLGAVARGNAALTTPLEGGFGTEGLEWTRVSLQHDTTLINRRKKLMHPRGVKWNRSSQAAPACPTDAEFATAANWTRVFEAKNIRIVFVEHNIGA